MKIREQETEENEPLYKDLVELMLNSKDQNGNALDEQLIVDECLTFMFGGSDTTATTMSWVFYHVCQNLDIQRKLQAHIDEVFKDKESLDIEDLNKLIYLKNIIQETLRITPVGHFLHRLCAKDTEINGVKIYKGTYLTANFYAVQHDPSLWKDPDVFNPDRWLEATVDSKTAFAFLPFSAGPRNCIGQKFAMQEMLVTLATILHKFDVEQNKEKKVTATIEGVYSPLGFEFKLKKRSTKN